MSLEHQERIGFCLFLSEEMNRRSSNTVFSGVAVICILLAVWSCNSPKKLAKVNTQSRCIESNGYWYEGKCWPEFEESFITLANVDSVVNAQMVAIQKTFVKVNDERYTIDFFFPEQEGEELILIVSFNELKHNLMIPFDAKLMDKKEFTAEALYMTGNIVEGGDDVQPKPIADGKMNVSINSDFEVKISGTLKGESEEYVIEVEADESVMGAGTSTFKIEGDKAFLSGTLGTITYHQLKDIIDYHPNVKTIVMENVRGSINDEVNMHTGRILREAGLNTKVLADSHIASGGVDLFASGVERTIVKGAKLGVHSWAGDDVTGDKLPKDHPAHQYQLKYFRQMLGNNFGPDFYFYTLSSAPADGMHYMSDQEIKDWTLATRFLEKGN